MAIRFRQYTQEPGFTEDFHAVRKFLLRISVQEPRPYHFLWGRWEWAFSLQFQDKLNLSKIGVWESDGEIVALVTYEDKPGTAYFCIDRDFNALKSDVLFYARDKLRNSENKSSVLILNTDRESQRIASRHGFVPTTYTEPNAVLDIDTDRIKYSLPPGYSLMSLADGYDLIQFHRVLWNGFNHEGEAPMADIELLYRKNSISGPDLNHELCMIAVSPEGEYAAYCGMWYQSGTDYALVEPVATDPKYRRLGLGKAVVLEAVRRCGLRGAKLAYVGSGQDFYYRIGFHPIPAGTFWAYSKP